MKPDMKDDEVETENSITPITGDVIGDTVYSERFVLKILLKLANLNTLQDEIKEKAFEEELCTLWDMAAERDVVMFLFKHDFLKLVNFALSSIESPRVIEIIIGIIGNMCCHKETVAMLLMKDTFLISLLECIGSDDSMILIQVLRLVSACLYLTSDQDLNKWMKIFEDLQYSTPLYFILKNSSHKDLLVAAIENFNTISSYFNTERFSVDYYHNFVNVEALESLVAAFVEVADTQHQSCESEELERVIVITMQITLNLLSFESSREIFADSKQTALKIVNIVLSYYEDKFVNLHEIDTDLVDIVESTNTVVNILVLSEVSQPEQYFSFAFNIWKTLNSITNHNDVSFEDESEHLNNFKRDIKGPLSILISSYLEKCQEADLRIALDVLGSQYDDIMNAVANEEVKSNIKKRTESYRSRGI